MSALLQMEAPSAVIRTYAQAVAYLESFIHYEQTPPLRKVREAFDLEGFRRFLTCLGSPQNKLRVIHVAGTKGKGSTCAMIASMLHCAGYRVGLYTSPHLISYRERIQIDAQNISAMRFARQITKVKAAIESDMEHSRKLRTVFEILTAMAFLEFVDRRVDFAVIETGLGGSLDATNVVKPLVSVLTPISLDHTDVLGNTVHQIAADKSGIVKSGCIAVSGFQPQAARKAIAARCRQQKAPRWDLQAQWKITDVRLDAKAIRWTLSSGHNRYPGLSCPLLGRVQAENGSLAILAVLALAKQSVCKASIKAMREGLKKVQWKGRFQMLEPNVILDGAHNVESARRLAEAFREIFPGQKAVLVLGVSREKDVRGMLRHLGPIAKAVVATQAESPRALDAADLAQLAGDATGIAALCIASPKQALREAKKIGMLVLVTGSLFLVGDILASTKA